MELNCKPPWFGTDSRSIPDDVDRQVIAAIQDGLPLTERPYAEVAAALNLEEASVISRIARLVERGIIKRLGVVVRHHELGYRANAMVVWDVPDRAVATYAASMRRCSFVTLCYRRPRRPPRWPYNLYCMIHGRDRAAVLEQIELMIESCGLRGISHEVLFSRRRFKQRGARYAYARQSSGGASRQRSSAVEWA